jgi:hypothetical protein
MQAYVLSLPKLGRHLECYNTVHYNIHLLSSFVCVFLLQLSTEHDND